MSINCYSSSELGLGTCLCCSHDPYLKTYITPGEVLRELIKSPALITGLFILFKNIKGVDLTMKRMFIILIVFGLLLGLFNLSLKEWAEEVIQAIEEFDYEVYLSRKRSEKAEEFLQKYETRRYKVSEGETFIGIARSICNGVETVEDTKDALMGLNPGMLRANSWIIVPIIE